MFFVYIIRNQAGYSYTGHTGNLDDRLARHNGNRELATKNRGPFKLVYKEVFKTRAEAMSREKFLKSGKGRAFIASLKIK